MKHLTMRTILDPSVYDETDQHISRINLGIDMEDYTAVTDDEFQWLMGVLNNNASKTFVQRILYPQKFPTLDLGDGNIATHRMAWGESGDKYVAFPTVLYDGKGLKDYGNGAWGEAMKSGNFIEFDNATDAEWFSKRYKGAWGGQMNKPPK